MQVSICLAALFELYSNGTIGKNYIEFPTNFDVFVPCILKIFNVIVSVKDR